METAVETIRDERIDIIKGIMILLVVWAHLPRMGECKEGLDVAVWWIYLFHMPIFVFITGYLFGHRKGTLRELIVVADRMLKPYFFAAVLSVGLYFVAAQIGVQTSADVSVDSFGECCWRIVSGRGGGALWYLYTYGVVELLCVGAMLLSEKVNQLRSCKLWLILVVTIIGAVGASKCGLYIVKVSLFAYFFIGFFMRRLSWALKGSGWFIVPIIAFVLVMDQNDSAWIEICRMGFVISILSFLLSVSEYLMKKMGWIGLVLSYVGRHTLTILIFHNIIAVGIRPLMHKLLKYEGSGISLCEDSEGFLRPVVDEMKCVVCGRCQNVCPANVQTAPDRFEHAEYFGGAACEESEVCSSTSGGVASVLARQILADGGVVFGAAYDPIPNVAHVCVESPSELNRLKGSKYVESDITKALPQVREVLKSGRKVLFIGLPCHVAALYGYLGGGAKGLYTIDLVCHGKPPQKLFSRWIATLEKELGGKISEYKFRDKKFCAWNDPATYRPFYRLEDGRSGRVLGSDNWYGRYFLGSASFRSSCYRCKFARLPRVGDITLADFWGAEKNPRFERFAKNGLSLVSVQSAAGRDLLHRSKRCLDLIEVESAFAIGCNRGINHASKHTVYRKLIYHFVYWPELIRRLCDAIVFGGAAWLKRMIKRGRE